MSTVELKSRILLTSTNYIAWLFAMEAKLLDIEAYGIVTGKTPIPSDTAVEKKNSWQKLNLQAYIKIVKNLSIDVINYVSSALTEPQSGVALWTLLREKYAGSNLAAQSVALNSLVHIKMSTLSAFLSDMRLANQRVILAGIQLPDQAKTLLMLDKLPSSFHSFCDIVTMGFATKTFDQILQRLES
ncbi:hypothetical protein PSTG_17887 [Puccinia striiformis f. sp. tritici PST-78]|uniref:Retrotransposon Copia-like N-terminal domain-containing protein n=1 Tax=Puccinia striiformis f. sp. tritici PST-78 TaxID=1165861 RepID=A0A0L0UNP3_9BASI|nr:hypothetical protein PSTG_17887 [Puccinia striiformis f. sp. tritici PST-78]